MSVAFLSARFSQEPPRSIHRVIADDRVVEVRENSKYRWLVFGNGIVQSAMVRRDPGRLALPYTESMLAPLVFRDAPQSVLALGIGGAGLVRYLHRRLPDARIAAVDSSPDVVRVARTYFELPPDSPRMRVVVADAREAVVRERGIDLLLVDLFDEQGMPEWVAREEFLSACLGALAPVGVMALNLMPGDEAQLAEMLRCARAVFDGHVLCATLVDYQNVILIAFPETPRERRVAVLGKHAHALEKRYRIPLGRILRNICGVNVCRGGELVV